MVHDSQTLSWLFFRTPRPSKTLAVHLNFRLFYVFFSTLLPLFTEARTLQPQWPQGRPLLLIFGASPTKRRKKKLFEDCILQNGNTWILLFSLFFPRWFSLYYADFWCWTAKSHWLPLFSHTPGHIFLKAPKAPMFADFPLFSAHLTDYHWVFQIFHWFLQTFADIHLFWYYLLFFSLLFSHGF